MSEARGLAHTRDFLLLTALEHAVRPAEPPPSLLEWHRLLGGGPCVWSSARLRCRVWGPPPATATPRAGSTEVRVACVVAGAPVGRAGLDPAALQHELLVSYLEEGLGALTRLDGAFCGLLLDERRGAFVFTDRFGLRKAFVVRQAHAAYAGSRAAVLGRGLDLPLDPAGVTCCTMVGHTMGRRSVFGGCEAVMPASAVEVGAGREERYWEIGRYLAERPLDRVAGEVLREKFNAACHVLLDGQATPALNLTGGLDTRAILSAALSARHAPVGVTSGAAERDIVDAVVSMSGITHCYVVLRDRGSDASAAFALLTDGECDAAHGGSLIDYWQRVTEHAPSGCLHGGLGEGWRAYYYKSLWPRLSSLRRDPLAYLAERMVRERIHLRPALRGDLRRNLLDIVRHDARPLWSMVEGAEGTGAAIDGFYLLERQRGLTRVASAADLWNPAYSPFGHSLFCEAALSYVGPQNRGDTLHRDIIFGNAPALAALDCYGGGSAMPLTGAGRSRVLAGGTARSLAGRLIGATWRRRFKIHLDRAMAGHAVDLSGCEAIDAYDADRLRSIRGTTVAGPGLGNLAAIAAVVSAPGSLVWHSLHAGVRAGMPPCHWTGGPKRASGAPASRSCALP